MNPDAVPPLFLVGSEGYIGSMVQTLRAPGGFVRIGNPRSPARQGVHTALPRSAPAGSRCLLLAAVAGERACEANRRLAYETNVDLVRRVCDLGFAKVVLASTTSLYGATATYATEDSPVNPTSYYTETKLQAEEIVRSAGPSHVVARLAIAIGVSVRMDWSSLVNQVVKCAVEGEPAVIYGPQAYRPYCDVYDVARGLLWLATTDEFSGQTVNVGSTGLNLTKMDIVAEVARMVPALRYELVERSDGRDYRVSFARFERGCAPTIGLRQSITNLVDRLTVGPREDALP